MSDFVPPFSDIVATLPATVPFVGPETLERRRGTQFRARIGANESAFGMSPAAIEAIARESSRAAWYNDPEGMEVRDALAARIGVRTEEVGLGAGIDDLLGVLVRMVVNPGTPVVTSLGAYPTFNYHVAGCGAVLHAVPFRGDHEDLDALSAKVHETGAPLVYLSNPDNPMGTWHEADAVQRFIDSMPERTLLVLDEAYHEFAPASALIPVDTSDPRVVRMRTFSKAYGMAGLRIGFCIAAEPVVSGFNRIRNHFGVNRLAQAAALASLGDDAFLSNVVQAVSDGRDDTYALARELSLSCVESATNFVCIDVGGGDRARSLLAEMDKREVFIRMPGVAPLDRCIRVSIGTPEEREIFATEFRATIANV